MNKTPPLLVDAIYISPTGRRCRWDRAEQNGNEPKWLSFDYVDGRSGVGGTGFTLSRSNLHILRMERRR